MAWRDEIIERSGWNNCWRNDLRQGCQVGLTYFVFEVGVLYHYCILSRHSLDGNHKNISCFKTDKSDADGGGDNNNNNNNININGNNYGNGNDYGKDSGNCNSNGK